MPQSEHVSDDASFVCAKLNIVIFNIAVTQTTMASHKAPSKHAQTLCRFTEQFGPVCDGDLIFACELGGHREGVTAAKEDFGNVVKEALPHTQSTTSGAYALVYKDIAQLKDNCVFVPPSGRDVEAHWTIFSGASQPAARPIYLISGNIHIRTPSSGPSPSIATRRRLTQLCLNCLAGLGAEYGDDAAVARILCGEVNLHIDDGMAATQGCMPPCSGVLRRRAVWPDGIVLPRRRTASAISSS